MTSIVRRFAIAAGAASLLVTAGVTTGTVPALTAHAASATAVNCVVSGSASIFPGLNVTPQPESFTYGGTATCTGVVNGQAVAAATGSINGSGSCPAGSLATCAGVGSISYTVSLGVGSVSGSGVLTQQGPAVEVTGTGTDSGGNLVAVSAAVVFAPSTVSTNLPVTSVTFHGTATAAG